MTPLFLYAMRIFKKLGMELFDHMLSYYINILMKTLPSISSKAHLIGMIYKSIHYIGTNIVH